MGNEKFIKALKALDGKTVVLPKEEALKTLRKLLANKVSYAMSISDKGIAISEAGLGSAEAISLLDKIMTNENE